MISADVEISTPFGGIVTADALEDSLNILVRIAFAGDEGPVKVRFSVRNGNGFYNDAFSLLKVPWDLRFPEFTNQDELSKLEARCFMHQAVLPRKEDLLLVTSDNEFEVVLPFNRHLQLLCCISKHLLPTAEDRLGTIVVEASLLPSLDWMRIGESHVITVCTKDNDLAMTVTESHFYEAPQPHFYCKILHYTVVQLLHHYRIQFGVQYVRLLNEEEIHLPREYILAIKQVMIYFAVPKNRRDITQSQSDMILTWKAVIAALVNGYHHTRKTSTIGLPWPHAIFIPRDMSAQAGNVFTQRESHLIFHLPAAGNAGAIIAIENENTDAPGTDLHVHVQQNAAFNDDVMDTDVLYDSAVDNLQHEAGEADDHAAADNMVNALPMNQMNFVKEVDAMSIDDQDIDFGDINANALAAQDVLDADDTVTATSSNGEPDAVNDIDNAFIETAMQVYSSDDDEPRMSEDSATFDLSAEDYREVYYKSLVSNNNVTVQKASQHGNNKNHYPCSTQDQLGSQLDNVTHSANGIAFNHKEGYCSIHGITEEEMNYFKEWATEGET